MYPLTFVAYKILFTNDCQNVKGAKVRQGRRTDKDRDKHEHRTTIGGDRKTTMTSLDDVIPSATILFLPATNVSIRAKPDNTAELLLLLLLLLLAAVVVAVVDYYYLMSR